MSSAIETYTEAVKPIVLPPLSLRKKFSRRAQRDYSQTQRRAFQLAFVVLNVWLGAALYVWVIAIENGDRVAGSLSRPAGVEGWLPIVGLMNLKYFLVTRTVPAVHPAAMFLLIAFLLTALLLRKAFCSWLCPVGTLSEYLWRLGRRIFRRNFQLPRAIDIPLRGLKYLLLAFFVLSVATMSAQAIAGFMTSPYGLIADVKMLNFFRFLSRTAAIVLVVLALASVLVQNFWCRYLCPYGALLGLASLLSPLQIRRDRDTCIDCAKCAKACPSWLPVDKLVTVKSAECTACLECVTVCPVQGGLQMSPVLMKRRIPTWAMAAAIAVIFFGTVTYAKRIGKWNSNLPAYMYRELVPRASQASHPMP